MISNPKQALLFIFTTILIDCIGIGIIIPVTPDLIKELVNGDLSTASVYGGWLLFSYALIQFIMAPILGGLSDRYGRRPILLLSLFGLGLDYIFLFFAPTIFWLFIGRLIAGVCGASWTTASAYIADISPPEKRAQNFGMIGAAFGIGFIIGPLLGSWIGTYGIRAPFIAAAGLSLLNWFYGYLILPESLAKENRRKFDIKRANPIGGLITINKYPAFLILMVAILLANIAGQAMPTIWTYFTMERFGWEMEYVGYSLAFVGLSIAIVQGGLIRIILPKLGQNNSIYVGLVLYIIGFILFAFAFEGWMMYAVMVIYAFGGIFGPALQGMMSSKVDANAQGELQGMMTSMMSLAAIISPPVMSFLFYEFTKKGAVVYFPGAPFLLGAVLTLLSLTFAVFAIRKHFKN